MAPNIRKNKTQMP